MYHEREEWGSGTKNSEKDCSSAHIPQQNVIMCTSWPYFSTWTTDLTQGIWVRWRGFHFSDYKTRIWNNTSHGKLWDTTVRVANIGGNEDKFELPGPTRPCQQPHTYLLASRRPSARSRKFPMITVYKNSKQMWWSARSTWVGVRTLLSLTVCCLSVC